MKQYIIIPEESLRNFPFEKIIIHCCHNTVEAAIDSLNCTRDLKRDGWTDNIVYYQEWKIHYNMTKILLVATMEELQYLWEHLNEVNVPISYGIKDIKLKEEICIVVGPITQDQANHLGINKMKIFNFDTYLQIYMKNCPVS